METKELMQNAALELRRGAVVLAVLGQLEKEQYGYSLLKSLSDLGMEIDQGTLYPLLRRLESQGLLESKWSIEESRPRRYYAISPQGLEVLALLKQEWLNLVALMSRLMK